MKEATSVGKAVMAIGNDFDASCKRLLSEKILLSHIMRSCLDEFSLIDPETIAKTCIVDIPRVGKEAVHRDDAASQTVHGLLTEDKTINENTTTFDIRFEANVPNNEETVRIEIDVEAQKKFDPGYPLTKRGIYYAGRMLSMQGTNEVVKSHYERVHKVASVWVCAKVPNGFAGTVTRFQLTQHNIVGTPPYDRQNYDLIDVVMICLDKDAQNANEGIIGLLSMLLLPGTSSENKLAKLEKEFGIMVTKEIEGKVKEMCNLSELYWEEAMDKGFKKGEEEGLKVGLKKGLKKGREEGLKKGREEGRAEGILDTVRSVMAATSSSAETVLNMLNITPEEYQALRAEL